MTGSSITPQDQVTRPWVLTDEERNASFGERSKFYARILRARAELRALDEEMADAILAWRDEVDPREPDPEWSEAFMHLLWDASEKLRAIGGQA